MAPPDNHEKHQDLKATDDMAVAAAEAPTDGDRREDAGTAEPLADPNSVDGRSDEKISQAAADDATSNASESTSSPKRPNLATVLSHASEASVAVSTGPVPKEDKAWYKNVNPLRWGKIPDIPKERIVSRETHAGFWSKLTFTWMGPLMTTGYKRQLHPNDIWSVNPNRAAEPLTRKVRESFGRRHKNGDKYPLFWALHEVLVREFWLGGLAAIITSVLQVVSPFTLRYLIQYAADAYAANMKNEAPPPIRNGIGLALGITVMQIFQSMGVSHLIYNGMMVGGQTRAVLIGLIYEKAMVISSQAKAGEKPPPSAETEAEAANEKKDKSKKKGKKGAAEQLKDGLGWGNGRIVNLMSVDTYRVDQSQALFHLLWAAPLSCIITLALLIVNLTYSALAGFALLMFSLPLLTKAIKSLLARRKAINAITDQRTSLMQEVLQAVRFVKYFGWEHAFLKRLSDIRSREIRSIQFLLAIRNAINAVSMSMPLFASMISFICYSLTQNDLPPAEVFSSLALFNGLRMPLNLLPLILGQVTDAWDSLVRIQEFLLERDEEETIVYNYKAEHAVDMTDASFTWERTKTVESEDKKGHSQAGKDKAKNKGTQEKPAADPSSHATAAVEEREPFKLEHLDLQVGRNELIAVIGSVGSGKSSLLSALAGDMRQTSGEVVFGASRAFCPQYAWIQNATLQQNITFGHDLDKTWYNEVVQACALQSDLDMLPHGDQTEIGERGINISGGQKQRLNIARAIYFDADVVLMDDPLSAVDAHVGRHIFDNAILGLLKDKCRILATHQLWVLNRCDRIVWMEQGKIQAVGTFDSLMREHKGFQHLMESTDSEKKDEDDDEDKDGEKKPEATSEEKAKKNKKQAALMQQEEKAVSSVPWSIYGAYIRASGSVWNAVLLVILLLISQGANISTSLWLSYWTSDKFGFKTGVYIGVYAALGVLQALLVFAFSVTLTIMGTNASKVMLKQAVTRVLRAPMSFFDTTPLGRITNRFSRDVDVLDNNLTDAIRMYMFTIAMITSIFALIIAFFHFFAVALVPLYFLFMFSAAYYRSSAREVKRYESVLRSNVFAKFGEGLTGVASIRAYGLKDKFVSDLRKSIDEMNAAYYLTFSNQRWLSVRVDTIANCLVLTVGILVVTSRFSVNPSIGGLVLSYILGIVQMLQFSVRQLAEVENGMNAVERLHHYGTQLEEEAPAHTIEVREKWPEKGEIVFDNVEMRYRENLPLVLSGLSMHVKPGERIGIVGRTGAGKSSIMSTLFRLVEISGGSITIDGVNISTIGLHDLRSRLAIIPQDPTLFRGTVRSNLDPFDEHTDLELWSALRQADLIPSDAAFEDRNTKAVEAASRINLDTVVEEDGLNFSLGQRQLMALARALVRGCQIIVCDEATSSVDMETDDKIQNTIATGFRGRTLLCIAHRLRTIIGYDRICVMEAGRIAELDTPANLWKREGGIFRGMCERSGIRQEDIDGAREGLKRLEED